MTRWIGVAARRVAALSAALACTIASLTMASPPASASTGAAQCPGTSCPPRQDGPVQQSLIAFTDMAPAVAYIVPTQGPVGTTVAVYGAGFTTVQAVYFGDAAATNVVLYSDMELTAAAPQGSGTVDVTVRSAYGTSAPKGSAQFTYTSPPAPPTLPPVTTPDGTFSLNLPPGTATPPSVTESCVAPANLPANMEAIGCLYDLSAPSLSPPGTVSLRYQPASLGGLSAERLCVYALQGAQGWQAVPSAVNPDESIVTAHASGPEVIALLLDTQSFPDLSAAAWAKPSIDTLLAAGVISGLPDGTFDPNAPVLRADFVKMLDVEEGIPPGSGQTSFTDVPAGAWYAPYVSAAVTAKLVNGTSPTTFSPDEAVTREEMAVLLARALQLPTGGSATFTDVGQIGSWALPGVEATVAAGYMQGFPDQTFRPLEAATRAQAAQVLATVWAHQALSPG